MKDSILIYAAGPIDLGTDIPNWRAQLVEKLASMGVTAVLFDPSTAYKCALWGKPDTERSGYIEDINREALNHASWFVCVLPGKVPSVGTPMELDWAVDLDMAMCVITDIPAGKSVYLDNRVNQMERVRCENLTDKDCAYIAIHEAAERIVKLATGPKQAGNG